MLEEELKKDYTDNVNNKPESEKQVDRFSQTTKLLDKELNDKKENILKVLEQGNLREIFENLLSSEDGELCIMSLLECGNNEEEIKNIILASLPEGYAYNLSTNEVVNIEEKKTEDFAGATTMDEKREQADEKTEQADEKTENSKITMELSKQIMKEAKQYNDYLLNKYPELALQVNENVQNVKKQLENNGVLDQLKESGYDNNFINDYILAQTTLQELKSNPTNYEQNDISYFDKIVKNLDNACNIPDTKLSSFDKDNIAQTRTELFNEDIGNDSLISAKKSNMESRDYSEVFHEMNDEELISEYGHLLEGNLKEFYKQYLNNSEEIKNKLNSLKNNPNPTEEESLLMKNYKDMVAELKNIKEQTENKTKDLMEELTIISQIKGMSMCIGQENGKDFNLNKANEIQNDNGVLTLKGHIDGVDFSVRHNTSKENARLQTDSKLGISEDKNTFTIGLEEQYTDSPFIMPSQEEIFSVIAKEVQSDSNDMKDFSDINSYFENLQQNIMGRMDEVYKDAKYAQHYFKNKVKGEKVMDRSLSLLRKVKPGIDTDLARPINQANSGKMCDFVKMLNFNIENSTDAEKDKLCQSISEIMKITDNYKNTRGITGFDTVNYPPIIENYLKNEIRLKDGNEDSKLGLVFDMLGYYNLNSKDTRSNSEGNEGAPSKIVINDLYRDLFEFSAGESEVSAKRINEDKEQKDRQEADSLLDSNSDLWYA